MKRIYKGSDLVFNLSVNNIPINMKLIKSIKFKFYTLNPTNYIEKSEADVDKDNQIVLQWHELENLEQGVLYYDYIVSLLDESMIDKSRDNVEKIMTDFYIVTHIEGSDINLRTVKWGNINGEITNQQDLVSYIDLTIDNLSNTYYNKTEIDNKESKLKEDAVGKKIVSRSSVNSGEIFNDYANNYARSGFSHAEGCNTTAYGSQSHAEGSSDDTNLKEKCDYYGFDYDNLTEDQIKDIVEDCGGLGIAYGASSHSEGGWTSAIGAYSHAEGNSTSASGYASHAEGNHTVTTNKAEHAEGKYNISNPNTISSIGVGDTEKLRKNAVEVMNDGKVYVDKIGNYDGKLTPTSKSVQEVVNAKLDTEIYNNDKMSTDRQLSSHHSVITYLNEEVDNKLDTDTYNADKAITDNIINNLKLKDDDIETDINTAFTIIDSNTKNIENLAARIAYLESIITNGTINCGNASTK